MGFGARLWAGIQANLHFVLPITVLFVAALAREFSDYWWLVFAVAGLVYGANYYYYHRQQKPTIVKKVRRHLSGGLQTCIHCSLRRVCCSGKEERG
jgi:hypothetical protein